MHPPKVWSRARQAVTEGGLFALGLVLVMTGTDMVAAGETLTGAIAIIAGGVLMVVNRYVKLPA